jgi:hypothetical protein
MSEHGERTPHRGGLRSVLTWIAVVAALAGAFAVVVALRAQRSAPTPPPEAAGTVGPVTPGHGSGSNSPGSTGSTPTDVGSATQHLLPVSEPRRIDIQAIGVHSDVISVGKNADGTVQVPQPGPDLNKAAWYDQSVTPGRPGPSVIVGHVDTTQGPSVFFDLGNLRPGDLVRVTRADATVVTYTVDGVRDYPQKSDFPTQLVYGGDLARPNLRLVTCSNFDSGIGHYVGNLVVFAHLTAVRKAGA